MSEIGKGEFEGKKWRIVATDGFGIYRLKLIDIDAPTILRKSRDFVDA